MSCGCNMWPNVLFTYLLLPPVQTFPFLFLQSPTHATADVLTNQHSYHVSSGCAVASVLVPLVVLPVCPCSCSHTARLYTA